LVLGRGQLQQETSQTGEKICGLFATSSVLVAQTSLGKLFIVCAIFGGIGRTSLKSGLSFFLGKNSSTFGWSVLT
jgi:hypothetical protein